MSGSIRLSCGHYSKEYPKDSIFVSYGDWSCDPIDGFAPAVVTASYCPDCASELYHSGRWLMTDEAEDAWLNQDPR
jgi:hypothetical protein